jgi:chromosome segregation ATPase
LVDTKIEGAIKDIQEYISELEAKLAKKDQEVAKAKETASKMESAKTSAAVKLKKMEDEMSELSSVYEELKGRKDVEIDIQEVMRLYVILTEQVLDGSSHIKLLTLLHGKKENMTKNELSMASGIQPAATLRAIFDLRNNGLVTYDENNETTKLVRRLFE